jgi:hypothetical protein
LVGLAGRKIFGQHPVAFTNRQVRQNTAGCLVTVFGLFRQQFHNNGGKRDGLVGKPLGHTRDMRMYELVRVGAIEGQFAGKQAIEHHAQVIVFGTITDRHIDEPALLGSDIMQVDRRMVARNTAIGIGRLRVGHVCETDLTSCRIDQQVRRAEVVMGNAVVMQLFHNPDEFPGDRNAGEHVYFIGTQILIQQNTIKMAQFGNMVAFCPHEPAEIQNPVELKRIQPGKCFGRLVAAGGDGYCF